MPSDIALALSFTLLDFSLIGRKLVDGVFLEIPVEIDNIIKVHGS